MSNDAMDEAASAIALQPLRDVRVEIRLPTPPILELAFYTGALLTGMLIGAVATLVARVAA